MAITTRSYLSGIGAASLLCAAAVIFPEVPPAVMLGALGAVFLAFASRTNRHARTLQAGDQAVTAERHRDPG